MASNEDYGDDASPLISSDSESSDSDSDSNKRTGNRRIAHKEMRNITLNDNEEGNGASAATAIQRTESLDFAESIETSKTEKRNIENEEREVFGGSSDEENCEAEKRFTNEKTEEQITDEQARAEIDQDLSKREDALDKVVEHEKSRPAGENKEIAGSPQSNNESEDEDDSKLSKTNVEQQDGVDHLDYPEEENSIIQQLNDSKPDDLPEDVDDSYIDAPVPSPFSDIGDISGSEHAIISDILKETSHGGQISSELEGFASHLENFEEPVDMPSLTKNEQSIIHELEEVSGAPDRSTAADIVPQEQIGEEGTTEVPSDEKEGTQKPGGSDVGGLIADIFGESDEEEEEFEGFGEEELYPEKTKGKARAIISDDEEEDEQAPAAAVSEEKEDVSKEIGRVPEPEEEESSDEERPPPREEMISDFDLMMQKKKEAMQQRRRRKRDFDIINDNDDIIAAMIRRMKDAAEEDRMLNQAGQAATKKMKMLDSVIAHLNKSDLQHTFIDCGILPVMKEWLSPLPDNSLPHLMIRKQFLKILSGFPPLDRGALKMSGIGRSLMLLYKHPKETRDNRNVAGRIISQWARPIFGVQTNFKDMTKEEREERDKMNVPSYKKRRTSSVDDNPSGGSSINSALQDEKRPRRPGDKGFVGRARVPRPSNRDYIVRPESNVGFEDMGYVGLKGAKKTMNRFEKQMRKFQDRKGARGTGSRAVSISINGSKMAL